MNIEDEIKELRDAVKEIRKDLQSAYDAEPSLMDGATADVFFQGAILAAVEDLELLDWDSALHEAVEANELIGAREDWIDPETIESEPVPDSVLASLWRQGKVGASKQYVTIGELYAMIEDEPNKQPEGPTRNPWLDWRPGQ